MRINRLRRTLHVAIVASLGSCSLGSVRDFLGCRWNVGDLHMRPDGGLARLDNDSLTNDNFRVYFHDEPFGDFGTWADFETKTEQDDGIVVARYVTNDEVPERGVTIHVVERARYTGHVVTFNQAPAPLLEECE